MAISRKDCKLVRVVINRAALGPAWFNETPSTPELAAVVAELRNQTREWLSANIIRELQYMMPPDERVKLSAHTATPPPQARLHKLEAEYAAHAEQVLAGHPRVVLGIDQASGPDASASAQYSVPAAAPAPAAAAPLSNPAEWPVPHRCACNRSAVYCNWPECCG